MATVETKQPTIAGVVFHDVTWDDYESMLQIVGNRPIRINYDCGEMELMPPLWRHGNGPFLLGRLVDTLVEKLEIPYEGADTVTFRRQDREKGIEPDRCFIFATMPGKYEANGNWT